MRFDRVEVGGVCEIPIIIETLLKFKTDILNGDLRLRDVIDLELTYTKILGESQIFSKFRSPKQFIFQLVYSIFL